MLDDVTSHVGLLTVEVFIPQSQSLKDKRHSIRSIKDRAKANFNVSVAELGGLDQWQAAVLGFVAIGPSPELHITNSRLEFI